MTEKQYLSLKAIFWVAMQNHKYFDDGEAIANGSFLCGKTGKMIKFDDAADTIIEQLNEYEKGENHENN